MSIYNGTREAFAAAMMELAEEDQRYLIISPDSMKAMRVTGFAEKYPDRFIELGIAEQNAIGSAAGLAACGLIPFVATYAGFITMRACEQVRTFVAYPRLNVKLIGANGGIFGGEREGVTHQFFEDLGILRTFADMVIVVPADASQVYAATKVIANYDGPAYLRVGNGREPVIFTGEVKFEIGKARKLVDNGQDVALMANGFILDRVLKAAEMLKSQGIGTTVLEIHTLKPLDTEAIANLARATRAVVTVEDHNVIGALGSAVAEVIAEHAPAALVRLGLQDVFPESGTAAELLDHYGMAVNDIVEAAKVAMGKRGRLGLV
jgi:transketolase